MSEQSKSQLRSENNSSFPNNNTGFITPDKLRTFNENMIDSTVNQTEYTADSASFDSRISAISGSDINLDSLNAFTASQEIINSELNAFTSSQETKNSTLETYTSSVDSDISNLESFTASQETKNSTLETYTASVDSDISNLESFTSSQENLNNTFATTGSNTFVGNQTINADLIVSGTINAYKIHTTIESSSVIFSSGSNVLGDASNDTQTLNGSVRVVNELTASGLNYPTADNGEFSFIQTDGSGNLSLQYVQTINDVIYAGENIVKGDPVYVSGSNGANPIVYKANAADPNKAAIYISADTISAGSTGRGIVLGHIEGVDLTGIAEGTTIYLGESGGWSTSRPSGSASIVQALGIVTKTGSGGKGEVLNPGPAILPNIQEGYLWVGDSGNQPTSIATSSLSTDTSGLATTGSNTFTGNQTINSTSDKSGVIFQTGSSEIFTGINASERFVISSSTLENYIEINPGSDFMEIYGKPNFNNQVTMRSDVTVRNVNTDGGAPYNLGYKFDIGEFTASLLDGYAWVGDANNRSYQVPTSSFGGGGGSDLTSLNLFTQSQEVINTNLASSASIYEDKFDTIGTQSGSWGGGGSDLTSLNSFTASQELLNGTFATTGSNTFNGTQTITGSVFQTGSQVQLTVGSALNSFLIDNGTDKFYTYGDTWGNLKGDNSQGIIMSNQYGFNVFNSSYTKDFGFAIDVNAAVGTGDSQIGFYGAGGGGYNTLITFQDSTNWTDGRVEFHTPISASAGFTGQANFDSDTQISGSLGVTGSFAVSGSSTTISSSISQEGDYTINGKVLSTFGAPGTNAQIDLVTITGSTDNDGRTYDVFTAGIQDYPSFGPSYGDAFVIEKFDSLSYNFGSTMLVSGPRATLATTVSGSGTLAVLSAQENGTLAQVLVSGDETLIIASNGKNTISGSVDMNSTLTASLQEGYVWVGDSSGRTTTVSTGSFGGGGAAFPYDGDAQISGSLGVTGSMSGYVNALSITSNTASVDFTDGNMFTLTLASSSVTHINPTNIQAGQTINIQITQPATSGSVTFAPSVLFAGGADYQATATGSAIDLLTLVSLDGTNVLATSIKNFQ